MPAVCVLHVNNIELGKFLPLSDTRTSPHEKLAKLHSIRDKRLLQPQDSPARMEGVCGKGWFTRTTVLPRHATTNVVTQAGHEKATRKVVAHLSCPCRARPVQVATIAFTHTKTGHDKGHEGRFRWHEAATTSYVGATTAIFCRAPMFLYRGDVFCMLGAPSPANCAGPGRLS